MPSSNSNPKLNGQQAKTGRLTFGSSKSKRQMRFGGLGRFSPKEKPRQPALKLIKKLFAYYLEEGKSIFFVSFIIILDTIIGCIIPWIIGEEISQIQNKNANLMQLFILALIASYLTSVFINITAGIVMNITTNKIVKVMRRRIFDKFQKLPLQYHDTHPHGELMSRITNDVGNISGTISQVTTTLISAALSIIMTATVMFVLNWRLALVVIAISPLVVVLTRIIAKVSLKMFIGQQRQLGVLDAIIEETSAGQKIVKAFNMQGEVAKEFEYNNNKLCKFSTSAQIWSGLLMPLNNVVINITYLSVAFVGGYLAIKGNLTVGVLATFLTYARQFSNPLNTVSGIFNNLQAGLAGAERVFDILESKEEAPDVPDAIELKDPKGQVEFKNVSFEYIENSPVLKSVSFKVSQGQSVALVGPTGAGKTTIVNLLSRFYDATKGSVLIDGIEIEKYKRDSLRKAFSVVLQDTALFSGTIADNIRYSKSDATEKEVFQAAQIARASNFIEQLPKGYETQISGQTDSLSQGERQLLAISRAVLNSAPISILDEATSSVDTRTEKDIQKGLNQLIQGRTSFIIAHRLSTIKDADVIFYVDEGEIKEQGTHQELLELNGYYARLHNLQFGD